MALETNVYQLTMTRQKFPKANLEFPKSKMYANSNRDIAGPLHGLQRQHAQDKLSSFSMALDTNVTYPIPISRLAHRYYVYNIDHVTLLRRQHNIPGILVGTLPQSPQQNIFLGLPLELLSEEARLLVKKGVAYIVDDSEVHRQGLGDLTDDERRKYMRALEAQGQEFQRAASDLAVVKKEQMLKRLPEHKRAKLKAAIESEKQRQKTLPGLDSTDPTNTEDDASQSLSPSFARSSHSTQLNLPQYSRQNPTPEVLTASGTASGSDRKIFHVTPTLSNPPFPYPSPSSLSSQPNPDNSPTPDSSVASKFTRQIQHASLPPVPSKSAYSVFEHLHSQSYFLSSGLRFGAQYSVYPGDPLRFHAHFLARGYDWDEEIDLLSLVGGGRLGTGVKKGYLIGGPVQSEISFSFGDNTNSGCSDPTAEKGVNVPVEYGGDDGVRCFSIEWAGI